MAGPILQSDTKVAWASRNNPSTSTRVERNDTTPPATSPDTRSPRIILPLAEKRFADSSPSSFPTPSPVLGRNAYKRPPLPTSERATPLSSGGHEGLLDADGMYVSNDVDGLQTPNLQTVSAPAELHQQHRKITMDTPEAKFSADAITSRHEHPSQPFGTRTHSAPIQKPGAHFQPNLATQQAIMEQQHQDSHQFHLDRTAPIRALRHPPASASTGAGGQFGSSLGIIEEQRGLSETPEFPLDAGKKPEPPEPNDDGPERAPSPGQVRGANEKRAEEPLTWGEPFRLQWVKTERLPFYRTRHLRNPWNHDREIKVSRDGTELEPSVGQALLEEWDRVIEAPSTEKPPQQSGQGGTGGGGRQQGRGKGGGGGGVQRGGKR